MSVFNPMPAQRLIATIEEKAAGVDVRKTDRRFRGGRAGQGLRSIDEEGSGPDDRLRA
jgi:hypothetical protein